MPASAFGLQMLPVIVTIVVVTLFLLVARRVDPWLVYPGTIALLGHVFVAVFVLPRVPFTWDIGQFHGAAVSVLEGSQTGASTSVSSFGAFQSLIYTLFAPDPVAVSIVNGLLAVLVVVTVREIALCLYPSLRSTKGLTLIVLFLPLPFFYLTVPMRDALSTLVFFTMVALFVRSYSTDSGWPVALAIPLFGILDLLRPELAFVILVGIAVAAGTFVLQNVTREPVSVRTMIATAAPIGLAVLPVLGPRLSVSSIETRMLGRTTDGAAYLEGATYDSWIDLVLVAPVRGVYFQFAPFPLHVSQVFHLLAALMLPVLVVLAVAAYRSARAYDRDVVVLAFLATIYVVGILGYGLIDANFGTTARHRIPFTFLLCIFAAPVFERWESRIRSRLGLATEWIGQ